MLTPCVGRGGDGAGSRQEALIHLSRRGAVAVSPAQEQPLRQRWEAPAPPLGWLAPRHPSSVIRCGACAPSQPGLWACRIQGGGGQRCRHREGPTSGELLEWYLHSQRAVCLPCDCPAGGRSLRIPPEPGGSEDLRLVSPPPRPQFPSLPSRWKTAGGSPSFLRALLQQGLADWSRQAASWFWK